MYNEETDLEINEEMKVVANFISTYVNWTDGMPDSSSIIWDGIVKRTTGKNYISAILNLQSAINNWATYSEKLDSLGLDKNNKKYYLESLGHMEISAR